jgi:hypothetical protein
MRKAGSQKDYSMVLGDTEAVEDIARVSVHFWSFWLKKCILVIQN